MFARRKIAPAGEIVVVPLFHWLSPDCDTSAQFEESEALVVTEADLDAAISGELYGDDVMAFATRLGVY